MNRYKGREKDKETKREKEAVRLSLKRALAEMAVRSIIGV